MQQYGGGAHPRRRNTKHLLVPVPRTIGMFTCRESSPQKDTGWRGGVERSYIFLLASGKIPEEESAFIFERCLSVAKIQTVNVVRGNFSFDAFHVLTITTCAICALRNVAVCSSKINTGLRQLRVARSSHNGIVGPL